MLKEFLPGKRSGDDSFWNLLSTGIATRWPRLPKTSRGSRRSMFYKYSCQVVLIFLQHFQLDVDICFKKGGYRKSDKMLTFVLKRYLRKVLCLQFLSGVFSDSAIRHKKQHHCAGGLFSTIPRSFLSLVLLNIIVVIKILGTFFSLFSPNKMIIKNDIRPCSKLARNPHLDAITLDLY